MTFFIVIFFQFYYQNAIETTAHLFLEFFGWPKFDPKGGRNLVPVAEIW